MGEDYGVAMDGPGSVRFRGAVERLREKAMFLTTSALRTRFEANLARSTRVDIATAWATEGSALDLLCEAARTGGVKVRAIVGTFGNATHPDALERLREIGKLRLAAGDRAMFHPKVYIFRGAARACAWIGSANLTGPGFARNEEVVHETERVADAATWFARRWKACGPLAPGAIDDYRKRCRRQGVSRRLVGLVGRADAGIAKRLACLRGADGWKAYLAALEECDESWRDEGFGWSVLGAQRSYVQTIAKAGPIARSESWIGLPPTSTAMLLGLDNSDGTWGLLGSMGAAGTAKQVFIRSREPDDRRVLRRLRQSVDRVIRADDGEVASVAISVLEDLCPRDGNGLPGFGPGVVTRLLTLARPDRLVSVNDGSRNGLGKLFRLAPTTLGTPQNYGRLLEELSKLPWYGDRPGRSGRERRLWSMRAALIDSFVYEPIR